MFKRLFIALFVLAMMLSVAGAIIFYIIDWQGFKNTLSEQVRRLTGHEMIIEGDLSLSLFPALEIHVNSISIKTHADNTQSIGFIDNMTISYAYSDIFFGDKTIDRMTLSNASIVFEKWLDRPSEKLDSWNISNSEAIRGQTPIRNIDINGLQITLNTGNYENPLSYSFFIDAVESTIDPQDGSIEASAYSSHDISQLAMEASLSLGPLVGHQSALKIEAEYGESQFYLDGTLSKDANQQPELAATIESLFHNQSNKGQANSNWDISSDLRYQNGRLSLNNFSLNNKNTRLDGSLQVDIASNNSQPNSLIALKSDHLDLSSLFIEEDTGLINQQQITPALISQVLYTIFSGSQVEYDINLPKIILENGLKTSITLKTSRKDNQLHYNLDINSLPGNTNIQGAGYHINNQDDLFADLTITSDKSSEFLSFIDAPQRYIKAEALNDLTAKMSVKWGLNSIEWSQLSLNSKQLDIIGRMVLDYTDGISINSAFKTPAINLKDIINNDAPQIRGVDGRELLFDNLRNMHLYLSQLTSSIDIGELTLENGQILESTKATMRVSPGILRIDDINLNYNKRPIRGSFSLNTQELDPKINIQIAAQSLDTKDLWGFLPTNAPTLSKAEKRFETRWSRDQLHLEDFDIYSGDVTFRSHVLTHNGIEFKNVAAALELQKGRVDIKSFVVDAYDGKIEGSGNITLNPLFTYISFATPDIQIRPALSSLFGFKVIDGRTGISGSLSFGGNSPMDWVETLQGSMNIVARRLTIRSFDLILLSRKISTLDDIRQVRHWGHKALHSGLSQFEYYTASIGIQRGLMTVRNSNLPHSILSRSKVSYEIDLPEWSFSLSAPMNIRTGVGSDIPIELSINGEISNLFTYWERKGIEDFWAERFFKGR